MKNEKTKLNKNMKTFTRFVFFILVLLISIITVSAVNAIDARVWTTDANGNLQEDYGPDETVYISGEGFLNNTELVSLCITRPDGVVECAPDDVKFSQEDALPTTDSDGKFEYYIYDLNGIFGEYQLNASDGTNVADDTFTDNPMKIDYPENDAVVSGVIDIEWHLKLKEDGPFDYDVFYTQSSECGSGNITSWTLIDTVTCGTENCDLEWNTTTVPNGDYCIGIEKSTGNYRQDRTGPFLIDNDKEQDLVCPDADYHFDVFMKLVKSTDTDSATLSDVEPGAYALEGRVIRGRVGLDQTQDNESFVLQKDGVYGNESWDDEDPDAITDRFEHLGDFNFTSGDNVFVMEPLFKAEDGTNSVEIEDICLYKVEQAECKSDSECSHLDNSYCSGDFIMEVQGVCVDGVCETEELESYDCNSDNSGNYCSTEGDSIVFDTYTCESAECVVENITVVETCDSYPGPSECYATGSCNYVGETESAQCVYDKLPDTEGPLTSSTAINPLYSNGIFNVTATAQDACSTIAGAEYFLGISGTPTCGDPETGDGTLVAFDGDFNELVEDLLAQDVEHVRDGLNWLCVNSKDSEDNWGNCDCIYFEADVMPPTIIKDVAINGVLNPDRVLTCESSPTVSATICDTQTDILGGEFFLNLLIPPHAIPAYWTGNWLEPLNHFRTEESLHCSDVEGAVDEDEFNTLSDGLHYVSQLRGVDMVENWGKLSNQNFEYSFIKDTMAPIVEKEIVFANGLYEVCDETEVNGSELTDGCYYVGNGTQITLSAYDFNPGSEENSGYNDEAGDYAGDVVIHYRIWWSYDGSDWSIIEEGFSQTDGEVYLTLDRGSYHLIEYWAEDGCGIESERHYELDIVDTLPPESEKNFEGKYLECSESDIANYGIEACNYVSQNTEVLITCQDVEPHPVEKEKISYKVDWREEWGDEWSEGEWIESGDFVSFNYEEDSFHRFSWFCEDALGNAEDVQVALDIVDSSAPVLEKTIGEPKVNCSSNGSEIESECTFITQETEITLECSDEGFHPVGDVSINYRTRWKENWNAEWDTWDEWTVVDDEIEVFTLPEDSIHEVEYFCEDALGNRAGSYYETDVVDSAEPETSKTVSDPKVPMETEGDWWITQDSLISLSCSDVMPHPVGDVELYYRYYESNGEAPDFNATGVDSISFQFDSDGEYIVEYYCVDALGNTEIIQDEIDHVDTASPDMNVFMMINGGERIFGTTVAVKENDTIKMCAEVLDHDMNRDNGVGVDEVFGRLSIGDVPIEMNLDSTEGDNVYCFETTAPAGCAVNHYEAMCDDLLGNTHSWMGNFTIITDNAKPMIKEVLNPPSGRYYRDGKPFSIYAPAIDFGGDELRYNEDSCPASGIAECKFFAFDIPYENINQSEINNYWDWEDQIHLAYRDAKGVYLGSVPFVDGVCKGLVSLPENSGMTDKAYLAYEVVDNAGNKVWSYAKDGDDNVILMDIDNDGPALFLTEDTNLPGPMTTGDTVKLTVDIDEYESGFDECWADVYHADNDTGLDIQGSALDFDTCEINGELPAGLESGEYWLSVKARDEQFNIGEVSTLMIVDNDRPDITLVSPIQNGVYGAIFPVSMAVSDVSGIASETVKMRIQEQPNIGNLYCFGGSCEDTGWITLEKQDNGLYAEMVNISENGISGQGRYFLDVVACDNLYVEEADTALGFSMGNSRTDMHCRMLSEHGMIDFDVRPTCDDGLDNDFDGAVDLADSSCQSPQDDEVNGLEEGV